MKCDAEKAPFCPYCVLNPPRLDDQTFAKLRFLPDPIVNESGEYKEYRDLYGTNTDERDMPSRKQKAVSTDRDKKFKSLLTAGKTNVLIQW